MTHAKSNIIVKPFGVQRQAIVSFADTHVVIGSPMIRDTISESSRPHDLLLAALATDCTFSCQDGAKSLGLSVQNMSTSTSWIESGAAEIRFTIGGLTDAQCAAILTFVKDNCALYKLLASSLSITLHIVV